MCYYDYCYTELRAKTVMTRKQHECGSCQRDYPAGTLMRMSVGLTEGDFSVTYACPACRFALAQEDHTALHLCWGWGFDGGDYMYGLETHDYIRYCLENGEAPTETGLEMALAQHRALEDAA